MPWRAFVACFSSACRVFGAARAAAAGPCPTSAVPIGATRVTDAGLTYLRNLKQLVYLGLRGNPITDAGVTQLSALGKLEGLHLGETRVGDKGIRALGTLRRLQKLWLDQTSVSDRAIDTLVQFQDLRELHIRQTRITATGKARLQQQLPKCQLFDSAD